jgi:hypothetical protein
LAVSALMLALSQWSTAVAVAGPSLERCCS